MTDERRRTDVPCDVQLSSKPPSEMINPDSASASAYFAVVPVWLFGRLHVRNIGVYAGLRSFAFGEPTCSPTEAELADRLGVSTRSVKRARAELIAAKAMAVSVSKGANGGRLVYTFSKRPSGTRAGWAKVPVALLGQVPPAAVGLYAVLRSFEGGTGAYPAVETIAARAGICHTQTKEYLRKLAQADAISVAGRVNDKGRTTSNFYRFPEIHQQSFIVAVQDCATTDLVTDPAQGWCQIPPGVGARFSPQTRTTTKIHDQELVGWDGPAARHQLVGCNSECSQERHQVPGDLGERDRPQAGPQNYLQSPGNAFAPIVGDSLVPVPAVAGGSSSGIRRPYGWLSQPMADATEEARVQELVELFVQGQADLERNAPSPAVLRDWEKSARNLLYGSNPRDYTEAYQLISKVCRDEYWSTRATKLYVVVTEWDEIFAEFDRREVSDIQQARRARRREKVNQRVDEAEQAKDEQQSVGSVSLLDLLEMSERSHRHGSEI